MRRAVVLLVAVVVQMCLAAHFAEATKPHMAVRSKKHSARKSSSSDGGKPSEYKSSNATAAVNVKNTTSNAAAAGPKNLTSSITNPLIKKMTAYYPSWNVNIMPPSKVNWALYDILQFAFVVPQDDGSLKFDSDQDKQTLRDLISEAHKHLKRVTISIGGWSDSTYFSWDVSDDTRSNFVNKVVELVQEYGADGVDFDWEYPNSSGSGSNKYSPSDLSNYYKFLSELRPKLGIGKIISLAVTEQLFVGSDNSIVTSVAPLRDLIDYVFIMNYDVWSASSVPGPNAPLSNACGDSAQPDFNAVTGIQAWLKGGLRPDQIVLGLASYGYISQSKRVSLVHKKRGEDNAEKRDTLVENERHVSPLRRAAALSKVNRAHREEFHTDIYKRDSDSETFAQNNAKNISVQYKQAMAAKKDPKQEDNVAAAKQAVFCPMNHGGGGCSNKGQNISEINWNPLSSVNGGSSGGKNLIPTHVSTQGDVSTFYGNQIEFSDLVSYGVLTRLPTLNFVGINGYIRNWDLCSSTPYLMNLARKVVVTYDDPESIALKAYNAYKSNLGGVGFWDVSGDYQDALASAARAALFLP